MLDALRVLGAFTIAPCRRYSLAGGTEGIGDEIDTWNSRDETYFIQVAFSSLACYHRIQLGPQLVKVV